MHKESQRHYDKGWAKTSLEKYTSQFIVTFACERELVTEQNCNILTPTLLAVSVVSFSFSRAAQPKAQGLSFLLSAGFLYYILSATSLDPNSSGAPRAPPPGFLCHILSATSLDPNSIGDPEGPFGLAWLSLPHLVSNSNCLTSCLDWII